MHAGGHFAHNALSSNKSDPNQAMLAHNDSFCSKRNTNGGKRRSHVACSALQGTRAGVFETVTRQHICFVYMRVYQCVCMHVCVCVCMYV
jgi:hypothetical protein